MKLDIRTPPMRRWVYSGKFVVLYDFSRPRGKEIVTRLPHYRLN